MTRDQAIELFGGLQGFPNMPGPECARWIDIFAALGMLKLDTPPTAHERMVIACRKRDISGKTIDILCDALEEAGLTVTAK